MANLRYAFLISSALAPGETFNVLYKPVSATLTEQQIQKNNLNLKK
jgi:hypothetical protein